MADLIPAGLTAQAGRSTAFDTWLDGLPRLARELITDWSLTPDGPPQARAEAALLPVRDDHRAVVLKIGFPRPDVEHEHLALRAWDGTAAVRLHRADPRRTALLLERPEPGHDLGELEIHQACEVVAGSYHRLHLPALPQLRRLSEAADRWAGRLATLHDHPAVPRRLVDHAASLAHDFAADPATDGRLVHTDLHYGTVLAGRRDHGPDWLAVDPRPLSGDPSFEVGPLLWNRWDEAVATGNLRNAVLDRIYAAVDRAGLDEDRARDWVIVRALVNVVDALVDRGVPPDSDEVTRSIVIAKAAQR
jgi:streptomycin 6-kinase